MVLGAGEARAEAVTIRDPAFGLPHVCADSDADAARQQGYEDVRDRMGQFLLVMRAGRGTLHGAIGLLADFLEDDTITRRQGYSSDELNLMYNRLPADGKAAIDAYLDGANEAIGDMLAITPSLDPPLELKFFAQPAVANKNNIFGNRNELTQGQGADPNYIAPGSGPYPGGGFQLTPELVMGFAVLQVRTFGLEAWNQIDMAEDLADLIATYGATTGQELWDDRHWKNDPLSPVSVPDPRTPGYGGPLASLSLEKQIEIAKAADKLVDRVHGRVKLPGYPERDYSEVLEPIRVARAERERKLREWGAWPALGSYAWMIAPGRSATGNPWIGGFPQTGIQVPSIMHYTEVRGGGAKGNGMAFVGAPYVLIGHTDNTAFTTTTAHLKMVDFYVEELVNGNFNTLKYNHHGVTADMAKRIEKVEQPNDPPLQVPVFRTNVVTSANGSTLGDRPVEAFAGDVAGDAEGGSGTTLVDSDTTFGGALVGGYVALVDGTGAGQIRQITIAAGDTLTVALAWATAPDGTTQYVAANSGGVITAVVGESPMWLEESTTAYGFSRFQRSDDVLDLRAAVRLIPSTHNFYNADNQPHNGIGSNTGTGNILYATSGFRRVRQDASDDRLPVDGTAPNAFNVVSGVVDSAGANTLTDTGAFTGQDFDAEAINFSYDNPDDNGVEYVVVITAGNGYHQARRISTNSDDTLTLEADWGTNPSAGDTYAVYQIYAMPEAVNPSEGFSANWNNKQAVANDTMLGENGRNHRVEVILEQLSLDNSITRDDQRELNKFVSGVEDPGTPGRYLLGRLNAAIAAHGDCGTIDDELNTNNAFPERGRAFMNPLIVEPDGTTVAASVESLAPSYVRGWATDLAVDIYGDEYGAAGVSLLATDAAIGWVLHAIDAAEGDVTDAYNQVYAGDYFNGADWKQVVRDSFCDYVIAHPTVGTKNRDNRNYNHPLAGLPCGNGCFDFDGNGVPDTHQTPVEFDPTPDGNRGTWEQIVEVGPTVTGEFIYPMGQSGHIDGAAVGFSASGVKQRLHTTTLQPLWRDWRFAPMLQVCQDVTFGGDEDGDTDNDGVLDAFERWYYGSLTNGAASDTDLDGADLAKEYRWGSDPTAADTDGDTTLDGNDVSPQDRLCVTGTLKKLKIQDDADPGEDKLSAKWIVPLRVCMGSDWQTACTVDADCGVAGRCRRININPQRDTVRVTLADDTPILDQEILENESLWTNKKGTKFSYADDDGINGPIRKIKVSASDNSNKLKLQVSAKDFDLSVAPDAAEGVVGLALGSRCFTQKTTNCDLDVVQGKYSCSQ
jgi:hypothetical protein